MLAADINNAPMRPAESIAAATSFTAAVAAAGRNGCNPRDVEAQLTQLMALVASLQLSGENMRAVTLKVFAEGQGHGDAKFIPWNTAKTRFDDLKISRIDTDTCKECYSWMWRVAVDGCRRLPDIVRELVRIRDAKNANARAAIRDKTDEIEQELGYLIKTVKKTYNIPSALAGFIAAHQSIKKNAQTRAKFENQVARLIALMNHFALRNQNVEDLARLLEMENIITPGTEKDAKGKIKKYNPPASRGRYVHGARDAERVRRSDLHYELLWSVVDKYWANLDDINNYLYEVLEPKVGGPMADTIARMQPAEKNPISQNFPVVPVVGSADTSDYLERLYQDVDPTQLPAWTGQFSVNGRGYLASLGVDPDSEEFRRFVLALAERDLSLVSTWRTLPGMNIGTQANDRSIRLYDFYRQILPDEVFDSVALDSTTGPIAINNYIGRGFKPELTFARLYVGGDSSLPSLARPMALPFLSATRRLADQSGADAPPPNTIYFSDIGKLYGQFNNAWRSRFYLNGADWPTVEHYIQAQKFSDYPARVEAIKQLPTALDAFNYGNDPDNAPFVRSNWDYVKDQIMYGAVYAKFDQNPELANLLLSTGDKKIVQHTPGDSYWGDGGDGSGRNILGQILMQVRSDIASGRENF